MAKEIGFFNIDDVLDALSNKLIGHPHVFGDVKANDSQAVLQNWEAIKKEEKKLRAASNSNAAEKSGAARRGFLENAGVNGSPENKRQSSSRWL